MCPLLFPERNAIGGTAVIRPTGGRCLGRPGLAFLHRTVTHVTVAKIAGLGIVVQGGAGVAAIRAEAGRSGIKFELRTVLTEMGESELVFGSDNLNVVLVIGITLGRGSACSGSVGRCRHACHHWHNGWRRRFYHFDPVSLKGELGRRFDGFSFSFFLDFRALGQEGAAVAVAVASTNAVVVSRVQRPTHIAETLIEIVIRVVFSEVDAEDAVGKRAFLGHDDDDDDFDGTGRTAVFPTNDDSSTMIF